MTQQVPLAMTTGVPTLLRSYLAGLTLSTGGGSVLFVVASGLAADSTNTDIMTLTGAIQKSGSATWSAGTGGGCLDTGSLAASTWYHVFLIKNPTTLAVDVLVSLSVSAPTLPSGYTLFRRIGSLRTTSGSVWTQFVQLDDTFLWSAPVQDVSVTTQSTTAVLRVLTVPTGIKVIAKIRGYFCSSAGTSVVLLTSPDETSAAANATTGNVTGVNISTAVSQAFNCDIRTDTSAQIRGIASVTLDVSFAIATYGWVDTRGKFN